MRVMSVSIGLHPKWEDSNHLRFQNDVLFPPRANSNNQARQQQCDGVDSLTHNALLIPRASQQHK